MTDELEERKKQFDEEIKFNLLTSTIIVGLIGVGKIIYYKYKQKRENK